MGWYYDPGTRKSKIEALTRSWETQGAGGVTVRTTCLAHCYRGGVFSGVLWSVWERTFTKDRQTAQPTERWINCDLMHCRGGLWGHKPMEEAMHPYYYSCPLGYLDRVPLETYGGHAEWRALVRQYHARRAARRATKGRARGNRQANLAAAAGQRA